MNWSAGKLAGEAKESQLASRLEGGGSPQDGFAAVARLAWGLLLAQYGSATTRGDSLTLLKGIRRTLIHAIIVRGAKAGNPDGRTMEGLLAQHQHTPGMLCCNFWLQLASHHVSETPHNLLIMQRGQREESTRP